MIIKDITGQDALISEIINTGKPVGLFLSNECGIWVAIDNSTGDAKTEDFNSKAEAINYLNEVNNKTAIATDNLSGASTMVAPLENSNQNEPEFKHEKKRGLPGFMHKFESIVQLLQDNDFIFCSETMLTKGNYAVEIMEIRTPSKESGELDDPTLDNLDYYGRIHSSNQKIGNQIVHFRPFNINDLLAKLMLVMDKMRINFKQTQELGAIPKASAMVKLTDDTMILQWFSRGLQATLFAPDED